MPELEEETESTELYPEAFKMAASYLNADLTVNKEIAGYTGTEANASPDRCWVLELSVPSRVDVNNTGNHQFSAVF
jgi:hypothetical protein